MQNKFNLHFIGVNITGYKFNDHFYDEYNTAL